MKTFKTFSLILSLCLAINANAYDVCIDGIYYNLIPKGKIAEVTSNGDNDSYEGNIVIPEKITTGGVEYSVTTIAPEAFWICRDLKSVQIPNSITRIGDSAFYQCNSLTSIKIPDSVTDLGSCTFRFCRSLSSVQLSNSITTIGLCTFERCPLTSIQIPESVTTIASSAFADCTSLTCIQLPNSITDIGWFAFQGCSSLTSINIPNSVTTIKDGVFSLCSSLTSIQIPNTVTSICRTAFRKCEKLNSVILGSGIQRIESQAFANCTNLENIYCNAVNVPSIDSDSFADSYIEYANLHVPAESLSEYRSTDPWSNFGNILALTPAGTEDIDLVDSQEYTNTIEKSCNTLTYTRNFTNTNWNALYVPFSMQYDDWSENFEIARLNDVHQFDDDEDGVVDRTVLESVKLKEGSSTEPNVPYMIKAKEVGEKTITLNDATLYAAEENSFDVTSWFTKFTFTGTYNTVTDMATKGHYAMADGGLKQASSDAVALGAFRWYLDITDRNGNPAPLNAKAVLLSFDDGEETAIEVINAQPENNGDVYSISGVKVGNDVNALPKGLYIMNGKKILVK